MKYKKYDRVEVEIMEYEQLNISTKKIRTEQKI